MARPASRKRPGGGLRQVWRERLIQALLALVLAALIYLRVAEGYGASGALVAAICGTWGYIILSTYAVRFMESREDPNRPNGPRPPGGGRFPGASP